MYKLQTVNSRFEVTWVPSVAILTSINHVSKRGWMRGYASLFTHIYVSGLNLFNLQLIRASVGLIHIQKRMG